MTAKWQGTIALLLLIIISYIDRVNISVMILNPDFASHFHLNENRMLQGMLMTCFLLGYGFSALLLTPVIESKLHYRQGLLSSVVIWALICAISPLLGLLGTVIGMIEIFGSQAPSGSLSGGNPAQLAHGISIALYNTAFGLIVAIPALIFWR